MSRAMDDAAQGGAGHDGGAAGDGGAGFRAPALGVPTWIDLVEAEVRKLTSRTSVRVALALMVALGIAGPLFETFLQAVLAKAATAGGDGPQGMPELVASHATSGVLKLRNFLLFRGMLIWVVAESWAGELTARTLREDLVRPVSRLSVLGAKWVAIQLFVAAGLLIPTVLSALLSVPLLGTEGFWGDVAIEVALTWVGDVGFATLVVLISLLLRSVGGTLVGVFLFWLVDQVLGWVLWGVESGRELFDMILKSWGMANLGWLVDAIIATRPWLPSAALNPYWTYTPDVGVAWQSQAAWVAVTGLSAVVAAAVFQRLDIE